MNTYLVKVKFGKDALYELSKLGEVEYISSVLNVYRLKTIYSIQVINMIDNVENVSLDGNVSIV